MGCWGVGELMLNDRTRKGWCPRTGKGQRLMGILAVTGFGSEALNESIVFTSSPKVPQSGGLSSLILF